RQTRRRCRGWPTCSPARPDQTPTPLRNPGHLGYGQPRLSSRWLFTRDGRQGGRRRAPGVRRLPRRPVHVAAATAGGFTGPRAVRASARPHPQEPLPEVPTVRPGNPPPREKGRRRVLCPSAVTAVTECAQNRDYISYPSCLTIWA